MKVENLISYISAFREKAISHRFNQQLALGALSKKSFDFYIAQDSLYLMDFAKAIAITAAKSFDSKDFSTLLHLADGALVAERELHNFYFKEFAITPVTKKGEACLSYTNFLISTAYSMSYEESLAALFPCFYLYKEVGKAILHKSSKENPYHKWIETYSGDEFEEVADKMNKVLEKAILEIDVNSKIGKRILELCKISSELELFFWEEAAKIS